MRAVLSCLKCLKCLKYLNEYHRENTAGKYRQGHLKHLNHIKLTYRPVDVSIRGIKGQDIAHTVSLQSFPSFVQSYGTRSSIQDATEVICIRTTYQKVVMDGVELKRMTVNTSVSTTSCHQDAIFQSNPSVIMPFIMFIANGVILLTKHVRERLHRDPS